MTDPFPTHGVVRPAKNGRTQVIRVQSREGRGARWSDAAEEAFLAKLAATCNITAAAEAAGFSTTTLYKRRARWPGFASAWDAAIDQGYARLEARLVELATDSLRAPDGGDGGGDGQADQRADVAAPGPVMTVSEVTNLLRLHRASARGGAPQNFAWRQGAPDPDAMRDSILRKIAAIERAGERAGETIPDAPA